MPVEAGIAGTAHRIWIMNDLRTSLSWGESRGNLQLGMDFHTPSHQTVVPTDVQLRTCSLQGQLNVNAAQMSMVILNSLRPFTHLLSPKVILIHMAFQALVFMLASRTLQVDLLRLDALGFWVDLPTCYIPGKGGKVGKSQPRPSQVACGSWSE